MTGNIPSVDGITSVKDAVNASVKANGAVTEWAPAEEGEWAKVG